jgi:hypothetical protein
MGGGEGGDGKAIGKRWKGFPEALSEESPGDEMHSKPI